MEAAGAISPEPAHEEMDDGEYFYPVNEDGGDASLYGDCEDASLELTSG